MKVDLDKLDIKDNYSLALLLLHQVKDVEEFSHISDLCYILDMDNLLKFLTYFGGTTLKVPTIAKLKSTMRTLILYQSYEIDNNTWEQSLELAGYPREEGRVAERYLTEFKKILKKVKVGNHELQ